MEVEDHFRISLSDEDCARVRSVLDLTALVVRELSLVPRVCPSARSFYELRRAATSLTSFQRSELRPPSELDSILPRHGRRRVWRQLRSIRPRVPALEPSVQCRRWLGALGWTLFAGWIAAIGALCASQGGAGFAQGLLVALVLAVAFRWTADTLSTEFPDGCSSLGDLAKRITPTRLEENDPQAERRVLDDIRRITADQLGLKLDSVKPQSRFVDDLGMS